MERSCRVVVEIAVDARHELTERRRIESVQIDSGRDREPCELGQGPAGRVVGGDVLGANRADEHSPLAP